MISNKIKLILGIIAIILFSYSFISGDKSILNPINISIFIMIIIITTISLVALIKEKYRK